MKKVAKIEPYNVPVVIEKDKHGYYAQCPDFQGCYAQGTSHEEVLENIKDVIKLHIEDRKSEREVISTSEFVSVSTLQVFA